MSKMIKMIMFKSETKPQVETSLSPKRKEKQNRKSNTFGNATNVEAFESDTQKGVVHKLEDERGRRIITLEALTAEVEDLDEELPPKSVEQIFKEQPWKQRHVMKPNKLQKRLGKALNQPVKISKAEMMMQKMGWKGGALGKTGEGIIEPIAPNLAYALQTKGFGQNVPPQATRKAKAVAKQQRRQKANRSKDCFKINVLRSILEFVTNEREVEILFDCKLPSKRRKAIHLMIQNIRGTFDENGEKELYYKGEARLAFERVLRWNRYTLTTQSVGVEPNRYLCVYKEPPPFMYLVTHLDLRGIPKKEKVETPPPDTRTKFEKKKKKNSLQNLILEIRKNVAESRRKAVENKDKAVEVDDDPDYIVVDDDTTDLDDKVDGDTTDLDDKVDGDTTDLVDDDKVCEDTAKSPDSVSSVTGHKGFGIITKTMYASCDTTTIHILKVVDTPEIDRLSLNENVKKIALPEFGNTEKANDDLNLGKNSETVEPSKIIHDKSNIVHKVADTGNEEAVLYEPSIVDDVTYKTMANIVQTNAKAPSDVCDKNVFREKSEIKNKTNEIASNDKNANTTRAPNDFKELSAEITNYDEGLVKSSTKFQNSDDMTHDCLNNQKYQKPANTSDNTPSFIENRSKINTELINNSLGTKSVSMTDIITNNSNIVVKTDENTIDNSITLVTDVLNNINDIVALNIDDISLPDETNAQTNKIKDKKTVSREKINAHFAEFSKNDKFTEFKFLGNFDDEEQETVTDFMNNFCLYLCDEPVSDEELEQTLKESKHGYCFKEDCNDAIVIIKDINVEESCRTGTQKKK